MNNTLANGLKLMELLALSADHHSVTQLARNLGLAKSGVWRLLATLKETGFIEQDARTRQYRASLKVLNMANATLERLGIRHKLRPFLDRLAHALAQPAYLSVPYNFRPMIVDVVYPGGMDGDAALTIGSVLPVHSSASGKLCAAHVPEEALDDFLSGVDFVENTPNTIADAEAFKAECRRARDQGFAITDSERAPEVAAVAVPIFNCNGDFVGAIGVTLPAGENSPEQWDNFRRAAVDAAEAASYALGYMLNTLV